jgi:MSHA biogenesis protein MshN
MSVINQVLNQLEERGAYAPEGQPMVRTVHHSRRNLTVPLLVAGLVLVAGLAAWQWVSARKPADSGKTNIAIKTDVAVLEKEMLPVQSAAIETTVSDTPDVVQPEVSFVPVSRLSMELSSVPLPAAPKSEKPRAAPKKQAAPAREKVAQKPVSTVPMKQVSPAQRVDAEFRKAVELMQQGRVSDAMAGYEKVLHLDGGHKAARQALVALLLEAGRNQDAEKALQDGVKGKPENTEFTMLLARLQVERGALDQASQTLERSLPYADTQADYQAFFAALLQRQNRHKEAVERYQKVLQLAPGNGVWLMGYGISLQALQRNIDAKQVFQRALDTQTLNAELQAFVQQKIKEL